MKQRVECRTPSFNTYIVRLAICMMENVYYFYERLNRRTGRITVRRYYILSIRSSRTTIMCIPT